MNLYEDDKKEEAIPDNFADQFSVTMHPYGCSFGFMKTRVLKPGTVVPEGQPVQPELVQITRMTTAHVKMMVFSIFRLIREQEKNQGVSTPVPEQTLKDMNVQPEEWAAFWGEIIKDEIPPTPAEVVPAQPAPTNTVGSQPLPA